MVVTFVSRNKHLRKLAFLSLGFSCVIVSVKIIFICNLFLLDMGSTPMFGIWAKVQPMLSMGLILILGIE